MPVRQSLAFSLWPVQTPISKAWSTELSFSILVDCGSEALILRNASSAQTGRCKVEGDEDGCYVAVGEGLGWGAVSECAGFMDRAMPVTHTPLHTLCGFNMGNCGHPWFHQKSQQCRRHTVCDSSQPSGAFSAFWALRHSEVCFLGQLGCG